MAVKGPSSMKTTTCVYRWCLLLLVAYITVSVNFLPVKGSVDVEVLSSALLKGQHGLFTCLVLVNGTSTAAMVTNWLKDGLVIKPDTRIYSFPRPNYNKLVIYDVRVTDTATYTCVTDDGQSEAYLVVRDPIQTYSQPVVVAVAGGNATLRCDGEHYDYIFWFKNDYLVDSVEPERFHSPGNGSVLYITNVSISDNGSFLCEFISITTTYRQVKLIVIDPDDQVSVSRSNSAALVGHAYEIRCKSNVLPLPQSVIWFNDSQLIRPSSRVTTWYDRETGTASLTIRSVARYDSYSIRCRFRQDLLAETFNYVSAVIHITPTDKPDPPTALTLDVIVSNDFSFRLKIMLSWIAPTYTGNLQMLAYRVTYWDENACRQSACDVDEYWLHSSVVSHLFDTRRRANHTQLCFSIQSVNNEGLSAPSDGKCLGVVLPPTQPPTSSPSSSESAITKATVTTPSRTVRSVGFQVVLKNVEKLCSNTSKVSKDIVTRALASLLGLLCSCTVMLTDVTAESYARLGGIIYYHGNVESANGDHIVERLTHYVQTGGKSLWVSGTNLLFLPGCPTRVEDGLCSIPLEDSLAVNCSESDGSTNTTVAVTSASSTESTSELLIVAVLISVVCVFSLAILIANFCLHRRRKRDSQRSLSKEFIVQYHVNGTAADGNGHVSTSRPSKSGSELSNQDQRTAVNRCPKRRDTATRNDSGVDTDSTGPFCGDVTYSSDDVFPYSESQGREETKV